MTDPDADLPTIMRMALRQETPGFAAEMAAMYRAADEYGKKDIIAFLESDGVHKVRELKAELEDGTPTSGDLNTWGKEGADG